MNINILAEIGGIPIFQTVQPLQALQALEKNPKLDSKPAHIFRNFGSFLCDFGIFLCAELNSKQCKLRESSTALASPSSKIFNISQNQPGMGVD